MWPSCTPAMPSVRKPLLEAGVTLYEFRRLSPGTRPNKSAGLVGGLGSSGGPGRAVPAR
jgi:hypothetical protein